MPKVLIREYDNSTTGIPASDNFAVVVPGYFGSPSEDAKKILIEQGVYELKSQADFTTYIGKTKGLLSDDGTPPVLLPINNIETDYHKYLRHMTVSDFNDSSKAVYEVTLIYSAADPLYGNLYGKNGHLLKTIVYDTFVEEVNSETGETETKVVPAQVTFMLERVTLEDVQDSLRTDEATKLQITSSASYCKIAITGTDYEGTSKFDKPQIGNQIAWELLGLGYTVLYKKMDPVQKGSDLDTEDFWAPLKDKSVCNKNYSR